MLCSIRDPPLDPYRPATHWCSFPAFFFFFFQSSAELSSRRRRRRLPSISKSNVGDDSGQPAIYPAMHIKPHDLYLYFGLTGISVYAGYTVCVSQPEGGTYLTSQSEILDPIPMPHSQPPFPIQSPSQMAAAYCPFPPNEYEYEFNFSLGPLRFDFISFQFQLQALFPLYPSQ